MTTWVKSWTVSKIMLYSLLVIRYFLYATHVHLFDYWYPSCPSRIMEICLPRRINHGVTIINRFEQIFTPNPKFWFKVHATDCIIFKIFSRHQQYLVYGVKGYTQSGSVKKEPSQLCTPKFQLPRRHNPYYY